MRTGIIGFPRVGKTSLFKILTHAHVEEHGRGEAHIGVARVADPRLDELAKVIKPKKVTHATIEYVDVGGVLKDVERDTARLAQLREVEALAHVVRLFRDDSIPHAPGEINPLRDIENVELELMLADLDMATRRLEKIERELRKHSTAELEHEQAVLTKCQETLEAQRPLREVEFSEEEQRTIRGYMFLSAKPMLCVMNLGDEEAAETDQVVAKHGLDAITEKRATAVTAICGKIETELAELPDEEAAEFLASYGLKDSGLDRLIHATHGLLGLLSFFTVNERECRAWTVPQGTTAVRAAGVVHTDMERGFIRAEVIRWDDLVTLGSMAAAREKGKILVEGKEFVVRDGDVLYFRHSG